MTVHDQVHRATLPLHQALSKTDEHLRAHSALDDHEATGLVRPHDNLRDTAGSRNAGPLILGFICGKNIT